jgi:hypothetical protein
MPRAENRKKPTGQAGGMNKGGFQNKQSGGAGSAFGGGNNAKQALLEKMKKQVEKKSE